MLFLNLYRFICPVRFFPKSEFAESLFGALFFLWGSFEEIGQLICLRANETQTKLSERARHSISSVYGANTPSHTYTSIYYILMYSAS